LPEDNKSFQNPFLSEQQNQPNGQNTQGQPMYHPPMPQMQQGENGQPMYYPYPPMPQMQQGENGQPIYYPYPPMPQIQQGEDGQPMPMYYPYSPMPQAQQGEDGKPMPMYYPYPPMPQAQQGENGQPMPMYYPYPPMPQAQQGENGQPMPMYYPYPPMPQEQQVPVMPQAQQVAQAVNETQSVPQEPLGQPQVSYNPPSQSFQPQAQSFSQPEKQADTYATQSEVQEPKVVAPQQLAQSEGLNESGHEVFLRQPVINSEKYLTSDKVSGEEVSSKDDMIVHEPRVSDSIFSTPTPVYNPEEGANAEDLAYLQNEEPEEDNHEVTNSFISSMQSLYAAIGASDATSEKKESENVSNEPLPNLMSAIDAVTNQKQDLKTFYSVPVEKPSTPVEFDPSQIDYQNYGAQAGYQPAQEPAVNEMQNQSFQNQMFEKQEQERFDEQEQQAYNQPSPPSMYQAAPHIDQKESQPVPHPAQPQDVYSSSFENGVAEQPISEEDAKDPQYWEFMNNLLERFDDGKVHTTMGANPAPVPAVTPAQPNYAPPEQEPEPDQRSLTNFGKNVEKPSSDRVIIPRAPKVFKKDFDETNFEPDSFEEEFGEFGDKNSKKKERPKRVKKEKLKKEKYPKDSVDSYNGNKKGFEKFLVSTFPMKGDSVKEIIRKMVVIISLLVLVGCGIYFTVNFVNKKQNESDVSKLAQIMQSSENNSDEWSEIRQKYPNVNFPSGMQAKFADLYAINQDLVGWIRINGLDIDLPVVQGKDNETYLKQNFEKKKSAYGAIFVNTNNNVDTLDLNTVIFGHRMHKDTQMFTNLREYATPAGFKKAPIIEFNTLYGNYKWKVYAAFITNGSTDGDNNGYVFNYIFPNLAYVNKQQWEETYGGYIAEINQRALYLTGVDIQPTDRLLTLSTCTYEFENARLVVVARMLRPGESTEIDSSQIAVNKNPRYPQAWYDKNGGTNPYSGYGQWKPVV